jgi:hypothetical protein
MSIASVVGKHLYDEYLKPGAKVFITKFAGKAASTAANFKTHDRAIPTQGVDGSVVLAPRDALHIPPYWMDSFRGHPWSDGKRAYTTTVSGSDIPTSSLFANTKVAKDTFTYVSPFTKNNYTAPNGARSTDDALTKWTPAAVGGIIPLYAWEVVESTVRFAPSGTKMRYKWARTYFIKEVYDDYMGYHGYDRYDSAIDGLPGPGWPGVFYSEDPWGAKYYGEGEPFIGAKNWATGNAFIAHFEYGQSIGPEKQQVLRWPRFYVDDAGTTKKIEYPTGTITSRDEIPFTVPQSETPTEATQPASYDGEPPVQPDMSDEDYEKLYGETTIPVLPSAPPQPDEDAQMTPPPDDEEDYIIVFRGIDMNVGDGEFVDANGRTGMDPGGKSAYSVAQAAELFEPYENMYGFVFGNYMAYVNNMKPSVMNWDKVYNYNDAYDYYSKMVEVSDTPTKRVGYIYSTWRASDLYPAHYRGQIVTSTDALELVDQPRLRAFDFGKAVTPYTRQEFVDFLTKETWNGKNNNDGYYCLAFEVDEADGQGYTNGFM